MVWKKMTLGEVCHIEKGNIGILKATQGNYPLVVLGEQRRTHNEYQFDGDAIVIPLVSSTGHGDRSMKRIHFQSGKFSIGSILCAVMPRDSSTLSAEFLYRYLDLNKEQELVSRMKGMANVSLSIKSIAEVEIPLPPIKIQQEIVDSFKYIETQTNALSSDQTLQLDLLKKLRQQILQDAVQGKLVPQDPNDEHASKLLKKVKAEKEQLIREKKIRKEKSLPEIKPEEIPYEIPENWVWCRLGNLIELISGQDLPPDQYSDTDNSGTAYITGASNLSEGNVLINRWTKNPKSIAFKGDLLLTCKGSGVGKMAYLSINKAHIARQIMSIRSHFISVDYIQKIVQTNVLFYKKVAKSLIPGIDRETVLSTPFPMPPFAEQNRIIYKIEQLMRVCKALEQSIQQNQKYTQELLQVALKEALEPKN